MQPLRTGTIRRPAIKSSGALPCPIPTQRWIYRPKMIDVAIFAFNRPDYLQNCVDSVRRNIPGVRIRIYDDASDDPKQLGYLQTLGEEAVLRSSTDKDRHGGLYANMNAALAGAVHDHLLMLQDDMQVVRLVSPDDLDQIRTIFAEDEARHFLGPLFMKADRMRRFRRELTPDRRLRTYVSPATHPKDKKHCLSFFDVHIAHVPRLRAANWFYENGEGGSAAKARDQFGAMPVMADPIAFFCPEVPFFRSRERKTLASRIAGRFVGKNLKAFTDMSAEEVKELKARDLSVWPIAEKFLRPTDPRVVRPFVYKDVKARLWLYALHKIEQRLRR